MPIALDHSLGKASIKRPRAPTCAFVGLVKRQWSGQKITSPFHFIASTATLGANQIYLDDDELHHSEMVAGPAWVILVSDWPSALSPNEIAGAGLKSLLEDHSAVQRQRQARDREMSYQLFSYFLSICSI